MKLETVVIVENNQLLAQMMKLSLAQRDVIVHNYDCADCLHFIEDIRPQLVIYDLKTIKADEQKFLSKLHQFVEAFGLKVLAMGNDSDADGPSRILLKPISPTGLYEKILEIIN